MAWIDPKTDWRPGDGVMADDLNRIEEDISQIRNIMRRGFSFGGKAVAGLMNQSHPQVIAISEIILRPQWRTFLSFNGVFPGPNVNRNLAFLVIRDAVFTGSNPTWAQLTNGAIYSIQLGNTGILYQLPDVADVTHGYAHIGFVNEFENVMVADYCQLYAAINPYPYQAT